MKTGRVLGTLLALGLMLVLALAPGQAQEPDEELQPQEPLSVDAAVSNSFVYQGVLTEGDEPVNGSRDMIFRFYTASNCASGLVNTVPRYGVAITDGLFSVDLFISTTSLFNGQALWLRVEVEGTVVGCQEILPVPYALSLRPGAIIEDTRDHLLVIDNTSTHAGDIDTLILRNASGGGEALEIAAENNAVAAFATNGIGVWGDSDNYYGVYGRSYSSGHAGVLARGVDFGPDLILAGNANTATGDNGNIHSDPAYPSSDIVLVTNDTIRIDLDNDADGEDADFEIYDKDNSKIFNVDESGQVWYSGALLGAFPRPAYDSGWVEMSTAGTCATRNHNIGGDVDDYVVDLQFRNTAGFGISNSGIGGDNYRSGGVLDARGGSWQDLTNTSIAICRWWGDTTIDDMRVRIWVYQ